MADTTIQKQGEVFISQSEYDALRLAGKLQSNTKYHITKTPKTGIDTMTNLDLTYGNTTVDYNTNDGMTINGQARFTYDGGTTKDVTMDMEVPIVAGDGITIDKVNGQEKVEVKLDTELTDEKYVAKRTTTSPASYLYAYDQYGDKSMQTAGSNTPYTIAERDANGNISVGTPIDDANATPKKYVDDGFVAKIKPISRTITAYVVSGDGIPSGIRVDGIAQPNSLAYRITGGVLRVGTPVGVNDATNKAYVDGLHHYTHHIEIRDATSEIFITLAIKNYPNAVTTLDGVTELVFALTEAVGEIPIMATGVVDGHNVHAVLVQSDRKLYARYYDSTKNMILTDKVQTLFNDTATVHDIVA